MAIVCFLVLGSAKPIHSYAAEPICHSSLNITINPTLCYAVLTPQQLLLGDYDPADYLVQIVDPTGQIIGDTLPGQYAGQTVEVQVTYQDGSYLCSTQISVFDESPPTLTLPPDAALACDEEPVPDISGYAQATDCLAVTVDYEDEWIESFCSVPRVLIIRTWTATDAQGLVSVDTQYITISRATQSQLRFPEDVEISCADYLADPSLIQPKKDKAGIPALVDNDRCGLIYSHQDQRLPTCGDPQRNFAILRRWTLLASCSSEIYEEDGLGNDNLQIIRVRDMDAPLIEPTVGPLIADQTAAETGLSKCSSTAFIPPPVVTDDCNEVTIRILTTIGELEYANGIDGAAGGRIPFPGLPLGGPHQIYYEATDACGNRTETSAYVNVIDESPPIMLCDQQITIALTSEGRGTILPSLIDRGVRDNCCLDRLQIKFETEPLTSFRDQINLFCVNQPQPVVLRAWDCQGNFNDCTTRVKTQDPVAATLVSSPPAIVEVDCQDDPAIYYESTYLAPTFGDNCPIDIQFAVRDSATTCGEQGLFRTWVVQDHPDRQPIRVTQWVRFLDQEAPLLEVTEPAPLCDADGDCQEAVQLNISVTDACVEGVALELAILQPDGSFAPDAYGQLSSQAGGFLLSGNYPVGIHPLRIEAVDGCGNVRSVVLTLEVIDCSPPELTCPTRRTFYIQNDQPMVIRPEELAEITNNNCTDAVLEFADGHSELVFGCDQLGLQQIEIWATDAVANRSKCTMEVDILAQDRSCLPLGSLSGRIVTEDGKGVGQVQLALNGIDTFHTMTDISGAFSFPAIPAGEDYELRPSKSINASNGLSTFDLVIISKHILGVDYLDSPYKILAADINKSGTISTIDVILARRVILSLTNFFGDHTDTWRFVRADYQFQDPSRPQQERFPEIVYFKSEESDMQINFIGIKYGDVNNSVRPEK